MRWPFCSIVHHLVSTEIPRRNHSIIACSRHAYILLFFAHIPFVVNHAFNATPPERLQQSGSPPEAGPVVPGPPHLKLVSLISCLAPWFLHTSDIVFKNVPPLLVFCPPTAKSWRRAWQQWKEFVVIFLSGWCLVVAWQMYLLVANFNELSARIT